MAHTAPWTRRIAGLLAALHLATFSLGAAAQSVTTVPITPNQVYVPYTPQTQQPR